MLGRSGKVSCPPFPGQVMAKHGHDPELMALYKSISDTFASAFPPGAASPAPGAPGATPPGGAPAPLGAPPGVERPMLDASAMERLRADPEIGAALRDPRMMAKFQRLLADPANVPRPAAPPPRRPAHDAPGTRPARCPAERELPRCPLVKITGQNHWSKSSERETKTLPAAPAVCLFRARAPGADASPPRAAGEAAGRGPRPRRARRQDAGPHAGPYRPHAGPSRPRAGPSRSRAGPTPPHAGPSRPHAGPIRCGVPPLLRASLCARSRIARAQPRRDAGSSPHRLFSGSHLRCRRRKRRPRARRRLRASFPGRRRCRRW